MKRFFEARKEMEEKLFGKEKNTMKTYFRADEAKKATGNKEIFARELKEATEEIIASMQENRVLHNNFNVMNCNSEKINVKNATKIAIGDRVYAIIGYHCGEMLAVKIGEEIVNGYANLYMIKNRVLFDESKLEFVNKFRVEKIAVVAPC